jgi:hypothetical protein
MDTSLTTTTDLNSTSSGAAAGLGLGTSLVFFLIALVALVAMWKIFVKAGKPGWAAIIPFYNLYVGLQIVGRPGWWLILFFIPLVNVVVSVIYAIDMAKAFGKDAVFGVVGLWLFSIIGYLILAFDGSQYVGPVASGASGAPAPTQPQGSVPPQSPTPPSTPSAPTV